MSKLIPIDITGISKTEDIMNKCHDVFKATLALKEDKPQLNGKEVLVPLKWLDYKAETFWHSASIELKQRLDILPCNNDITSALCNNNCLLEIDYIMLNGIKREKCIYRAVRVNWIRAVLEMCNDNDPRIKYWEKIHSSNKRNRIYLRYEEEEVDFLVILEDISEKRVRFITAYPIFFLSAKRDYENDYHNYQKIKSR
ncbi:hypothetical protein NSB25_03115 [Acetatifactor muris]|jgi:hypothetical protein|uniref:Phage-Barnase-EndoU-ColicinE5/D-RelE like nuclease 2 domain-containing protein n=1 Tax=Acetatifactor muris TaxID=879566 RepID=A0A2K4ZAY1_9FIRM|nr:hypothetical protein [Acetatifactor muris]MCI8798511.1 hypothetical protein [Lachnospiraceae bacterium]MCR2046268.1 hypothetical protein [Acetatifactor muris]SOY27625.1 hypothetical protein AMURIS_00329 [Acetatifactor muris]